MFTFKVFDDAVAPELADAIEDYYLENLSWEYSRNISGISPDKVNTPKWINIAPVQNGFAANIFEEGINDQTAFDLIYPLIYDVNAMIPVGLILERVRAGMFLSTPRGGAHLPHVDYYFPHYTLLYYVNDSDGDTILWQEKVSQSDPEQYPDGFSILERIPPKKGRAVLFNGLHYHSSSLPKKHTERVVVNINLLTNPE